jgi:hypothetical protein
VLLLVVLLIETSDDVTAISVVRVAKLLDMGAEPTLPAIRIETEILHGPPPKQLKRALARQIFAPAILGDLIPQIQGRDRVLVETFQLGLSHKSPIAMRGHVGFTSGSPLVI